MVKATAISSVFTAVAATPKTAARVTFSRPGKVSFVIEGLGSDSADKKLIGEVYRGNSGATPGAALTCKNLDGLDEDPANLASVTDVFSSEVGYTITGSQPPIQRPTSHSQHNRQTITFQGNPGDVFDFRVQQYVGGTNAPCQVTTLIQG